MPIREIDNSAYELDPEHLAPTHPVKKDVEPLSAVDHSTITYLPIEKRFYTEHPEVSAMGTAQLQSLRQTSRIQVWGANVPKPGTAFYHFGFDQTLLDSLTRCGYQEPTPIQQQAIPVALSGRDIIGIAKTGSGKTAAFLLPMLVHLMDQEELKKGEGPVGLVLAPTRELAQQIQNEARKLAKGYGITVMAVYGGTSKMDQFKLLRYGTVDIVVGTPGRLIDLVRMKATNLCRVSYLVLDEADRMFDLGFEPQVRSICDRVRPDRQTLLFSATFPSKIERLALQVATDPVRITIGKVGEASADITQSFHIFTNGTAKWDWILQQMPTLCIEGSVLVFAGQMGTVEKLAELLAESHIPCAALHGNLLQSERNRVLRDFRSGQIAVLVATDVAARGLDIAMVRTVINFEVARDIDSHIHRIGRTGRAGHQGTAITLLTPKDNHMAGFFVRHLELAGQTVPQTLMDLALQPQLNLLRKHLNNKLVKMQPMPIALKQLLAKGDPITLGSLFNQARQRRQQPQDSLPPPPLLPTLTAYIVATETKSEEGSLLKKYTAYKVLVSRGTIQHWIIKRYSDFDQLHTKLTSEFPQKVLPTLPPKRLFGSNLSTEFVLARREQLNQYLDALLRYPDLQQTETIKTFFEVWAIAGLTQSSPSSLPSVPSDASAGGSLWRNLRRRINPRRTRSPNLSLVKGEALDGARDGYPQISTPPAEESIKRRNSHLQFSRIKLGLTPRHLLGKRRKVFKSVHAEDKSLGPGCQNSGYDSDWLTADTAKLVYPKDHTTVEDFSLLKLIGKGGYGKVLLARHKNTGNVYAIKVISKSQLNTKPANIARIMAERAVLERSIDHPFLVGLRYAFQTPEKLYFCIDYVNGGDLYFHLHQDRRFDEARARFYVAEITLALEYLHGMQIIYRDLKPENCLLDAQGHIRLVDFGLAKDMSDTESQRTSTICGTAEYLAPEVILRQPYDTAVDWYCLGAILYEMLVGWPPYYCPNKKSMLFAIVHGELHFPDFLGPVTRDFIRGLLDRNPQARLGAGPSGSRDVKAHPFFADVNWERLYNKQETPPYNPGVTGIFDLRHIDPSFSNESISSSIADDTSTEVAFVNVKGRVNSSNSSVLLAAQPTLKSLTQPSPNPGEELLEEPCSPQISTSDRASVVDQRPFRGFSFVAPHADDPLDEWW
ncbi:hypothetical protein IWQ61_008626 [Dispira simplex]|nr:hypothetical protein IWQ61_008626 [Dispira simplex]